LYVAAEDDVENQYSWDEHNVMNCTLGVN